MPPQAPSGDGGVNRAKQVPAVAGDVEEHGDSAVRLVARLADELDPSRCHAAMGGGEVVHPQEEPNPPGVLPPDDRLLLVAIGARQQDAGGGTGWPDDDPPLRPAVVGRCRRVFDELEAHVIDEEGDRIVVVMDDDGYEFEFHHPTMAEDARLEITRSLTA